MKLFYLKNQAFSTVMLVGKLSKITIYRGMKLKGDNMLQYFKSFIEEFKRKLQEANDSQSSNEEVKNEQ